ncbi:hypothetical protein [Mycobacterium sp. IS-1264]|uniref:hypothetical protein n=1 Tax=Mycobacterium sp. IS-1264 TaxID=1834158 RepID=UPI00096F8CC6|nr:hypothetical protein [Mycobacterium sp. IS-1264]OMC44056.1 hypothetical protein A5744_13060 [Mycobacterium sp. IS-1264]
MSGHRKIALGVLAAAALGCAVWLSPAASAIQPSAWNGPYLLTFAANQKTGTSMAARQPETSQRASYSFTSNCSTGVCVATVNNPPAPKSPYEQRSVQFAWNGSQWVQQINRTWDCPLLGGRVERDPARSITALTPAADGTLTGVFHIDIVSGACAGSMEMPVTATPVSPPVI